jgi:hypothetical protein
MSPAAVADVPHPARPRRLALALGLALILAGLGLYGFRLTLGTNLGDEAYYANLIIGRLRQPPGDTGDLSAHQFSALLIEPAIRLYARFVPDYTGVILYLRCVYAALALLTAFCAWHLLRALLPPRTACVVALIPVAFIPFGLPAPSYNTIAMLGTVAALCLCAAGLLRYWEQPAGGSRAGRQMAPLAGALMALAVIAYPTAVLSAVVFLVLACLLAPNWKCTRPLRAVGGFGAAFLVIGLGTVVVLLGHDKVQTILDYDRDAGVHLRWQATLQMGWDQFTRRPLLPLYCLLGIAVVFAGRRFQWPWLTAACAVALSALGVAVMRMPIPAYFVRGHDLVFFIVVAALPILSDLLDRQSLTPGRRVLLLLYCTGAVGGLITTWTASNALYNFPIGGLLAVLAAVAYLSLSPVAPPAPALIGRSAFPAACVAALAWCSFFTVYGAGARNLSALKVVVTSGPFAGLRTTRDQAALIEEITRQLAACEGRCRTVLVLSPDAGLYLLTTLKPQTPHSFFLPADDPGRGLWARLRAMTADPARSPDLIVDFRYQVVLSIDPFQSVLDANYRPLSPGRAQLYVRRDIPTPPVQCPYALNFDHAPPGAGWGASEVWPDGHAHFVWMMAREATLRLPRPACDGPLRLRLHAVAAMSEDILDSLELTVNGRRVALSSATVPDGRTYDATLAPELLSSSSDSIDLRLSVSRTIVPPGDVRTLAIAFQSLALTEEPRSPETAPAR